MIWILQNNIIKGLLERYHKEVDEFFEKEIRNRHAADSAQEIKTRTDLDFLEVCLRELYIEHSKHTRLTPQQFEIIKSKIM